MQTKRKNTAFYIGIGFLLLLLAIYILYHLFSLFKKDASFFTVRPYTADESVTFHGYLFREEMPLASTRGGTCFYRFRDAEKVGKDKPVADIYLQCPDEVRQRADEIRSAIDIYERSSALGRVTLQEAEKTIDRLSFEITEKTAAGDTASASAIREELVIWMAKKDLLTSGKDNYNPEIAALQAELAGITRSLGAPAETIITPKSGYFYAWSDGLSSVFTVEAAKSATLDNFGYFETATPQQNPAVIGTVVTSPDWYYIAKTAESDGNGFTVGQKYSCKFDGYPYEIPMELTAKETENGFSLLTFHSRSLPSGFSAVRSCKMEAVKASYMGFRIPTETVRVENGVTFVYIFKDGVATRRQVEIIKEQNGYFLVSEKPKDLAENYRPLKLNDLIILDETDLYDGKIIE